MSTAVAAPVDFEALAVSINADHLSSLSNASEAMEYARRAGTALVQAKAACGRGKWLAWLEDNIHFSQQTASCYMRIAANWGQITAQSRNLKDHLKLLTDESAEDEEQQEDEENEKENEQETDAAQNGRLQTTKKVRCERCERVNSTGDDCSVCAELRKAKKKQTARKKKPKPEPQAADSDADETILTDAEGETVPECAREAFKLRPAFEDWCKRLGGMLKEAEEFCRGPAGRLLHIATLQHSLGDAKGTIWANRPTHVCPYCKGLSAKGTYRDPRSHRTKEGCECCGGDGWVAKHIWTSAPGNDPKARKGK